MPITSPVERISGPRMVSTPANFANGNTASLTATCLGVTSLMPSSRSVLPTAMRAAILASGTPVTFETNGTVRDARGLTSRMKMPRPSRGTANCTFIRPRTPSSRASARAWRLDRFDGLRRQRVRRQAAGRVARVDAGLLDVLHHAADDDVVPVGDHVDVDLDRVGQELVDQDRRVLSPARDARLSRRDASIAVWTNCARPDGSWTISIARPPST